MATFAPEVRPALKVSPSIDERMIEQFAPKQVGGQAPEPDLELNGLADAVKVTRIDAHRLVAMAEQVYADPTQTPSAAAVQVRNAALNAAQRVTTKLDAAHARATATIASIDKQTHAPPPPRDQAGLAGEAMIVTALREMDDKTRDAVINAAFAAKDMGTIGAILRLPAFVSGINQTKLDNIRHRFREANFPDLMKRRERLEKGVAAARTAGLAFVELITSAADDKFAIAAEKAQSRRVAALAHTEDDDG